MARALPTAGTVCEGRLVRLAWPEPDELERMVQLRNHPQVRRWAFDDTPADPSSIWAMYRFRLCWPSQSFFAVRLKEDDSFLGSFGWSGWDTDTDTVWLGQLAMDPAALRGVSGRLGRASLGLAHDTARTLRDYVFARLGLTAMFTYHVAGNTLSERVVMEAGMVEFERTRRTRTDGTSIEIVLCRQTIELWNCLPIHATWMA